MKNELHWSLRQDSPIRKQLTEYDLKGLASHYSSFETLELAEKYAVLDAIFLLRNYDINAELLSRHLSFLRENNLLAVFNLKFKSETASTFERELSEFFIDTDFSQASYITADCLFSGGFRLLQNGNCELAIPFLQRSIRLFQSEHLSCHVFRSQFSLAVCYLKLRDHSAFQEEYTSLMKGISQLPVGFQLYYTKFLFFLERYLGRFEEARAHLEACLSRNPPDLYSDLRFGLQKHLVYLSVLEGKISAKLPTGASARDVYVVDQLLQIRTHPLPNIHTIRQLLKGWEKNADVIDRPLLLHVLFEELLSTKKFRLLFETFQAVENNNEVNKAIVPTFDLRIYKLIAYRANGLQTKFNREWARFQAAHMPQVIEAANLKLAALEKLRKRPLLLMSSRQELHIDGKPIRLARSQMIFDLISILASSKKPVSVDKLKTLLFGTKVSQLSADSRFDDLISRSRRLLGEKSILVRTENTVYFHEDYAIEIVSERKLGSAERRQHILKFAKECRHSFSIAQLQEQLNYPRRSLQQDLASLCKESLLVREGRGKSARYALINQSSAIKFSN